MSTYRIIRNKKEKTITIKKGFRTYAVYSGRAYEWTDEEIMEDFFENFD